jgi:hypothetical protein
MSSDLSIVPPRLEGPGPDDGTPNPRQSLRRKRAPEPAPESPPQTDPGQRLVIEETSDGLVYTVIDRASGAVVATASREEVAQLGQKPDYAAGALIRAKA